MRKGSIVQLKRDNFFSQQDRARLAHDGFTVPEVETPYVLDSNPTEYNCCRCGGVHIGISLMEYPGIIFQAEGFGEVAGPEKIDLEALLSS